MAFSLSYAYAFSQIRPPDSVTDIVIFDYSDGYELVWQKLAQNDAHPFIFVIVAPGLVFKIYPQQIAFIMVFKCLIDQEEYHRLGFPLSRLSLSDQGIEKIISKI